MKKTFVFSSLLLVSYLGFSQSVELVNPVTNVEATAATLTGAGEMVAEWPVTNITSGAVAIKARREVVSEIAGSQNYFCWGVCYDVNTNLSVLSQTIQAQDTNYTFYAHYKPLGNVGQTDINYCFFNTANTTDMACHTVHYCFECTVDVQETVNHSLAMTLQGANPIHGLTFLNYQLPTGQNQGKLVVYDLAGNLVKTATVKGNSGSVLLTSEDFASGIYLVQIQSGKEVNSLKIVVE